MHGWTTRIGTFGHGSTREQQTAGVKDDWAWWQWHGEQAHAGKLLISFSPEENAAQLFFDDNVRHNDARIVDCRSSRGERLDAASCLNKLCTSVNAVEVVLDEGYVVDKLEVCHGDGLGLRSASKAIRADRTHSKEVNIGDYGAIRGETMESMEGSKVLPPEAPELDHPATSTLEPQVEELESEIGFQHAEQRQRGNLSNPVEENVSEACQRPATRRAPDRRWFFESFCCSRGGR